MLHPVTTTAPYLRPLLLRLPSSSGAKPLPEQDERSSQVTTGLNVLNRTPLAYAGIWYYAGNGTPIFSYQETIVSYGTRLVVCDIRAWPFTGGTPFALSLKALRLPYATKSSKITSYACHFGDRATVSSKAMDGRKNGDVKR